jgi:hypothetical protein
MYEVLCERCWHTETVESEGAPKQACPVCGAESAWLGPFVQTPQRFSRRESWPVLTSPLYVHAGRPDRRARPR